MHVVVCVGPLSAGLVPPKVDGIESLVRAARPGEVVSTGRCPSCCGTGVRTFRLGTLRCLSFCPSCRGSGIAEGAFRVRVVGEERSSHVTAVLAWAGEHRVRTDVGMLLRDERGPGWALRWCGLDERPLRRWRGRFVAHQALGVLVDHDDIHVALHAVRDDGRVVIAGVWDVRIADDGTPVRSWCGRASRSIAWRRRIGFPVEVVQQALQETRAPRNTARPAHRQPRCDQRQPVTAAILTTSAAQVATN
jgi:hypothetical protein